MNIRALTGFIDPGWPIAPERIASLGSGLKSAREALTSIGYEVQTLRLATPPPSEMDRPVPPADRKEMARQLEAECFVQGIDYACIGPATTNEPEGYRVLPEILSATRTVFSSAFFADAEGGISLDAARACGAAMHEIASLSPDGFGNLRFAALANVSPGAPFFPAAYHIGGPPAIALAVEGAVVAVEAFKDASSLAIARRRLIRRIEGHSAVLQRIMEPLAAQHELRFLGIDFSLAPFPEQSRSLGSAFEALGLPAVGLAGSVACAAFIADSLDQAQFRRTGFCGLLLPVLEDAVLAERASTGTLGVYDLLLYACVCGAGLDTIPLPGDTAPAALTALLIDLGAIALRHNKPLTARLMPIPGKIAGEEINFDFPYFADSAIMSLPAVPLGRMFGGSGVLDIGQLPQ